MRGFRANMGNGRPCYVDVGIDPVQDDVLLHVTPINDAGEPAGHPHAIVRMRMPEGAFCADAMFAAVRDIVDRRKRAAELAQSTGGPTRP